MIRHTLRGFTRILQDIVGPVGITTAEFRILRTLGEYGAVTQVELANWAAMDRPYAAAIVRRLLAMKLIDARRSKADRRKVDLLLTSKGEKILQDMALQLGAANQRAVVGIPRNELIVFESVLERMRQNLEEITSAD